MSATSGAFKAGEASKPDNHKYQIIKRAATGWDESNNINLIYDVIYDAVNFSSIAVDFVCYW